MAKVNGDDPIFQRIMTLALPFPPLTVAVGSSLGAEKVVASER